jgi:phosphate-selective porin OprO/OprP
MTISIPSHLKRHRLSAALLAGVLFTAPAMAALDDAKAILEVLLKKGVITQKDYDKTLEEWDSKPLDSVPPVQFVQDALGVPAKEVQKAVEYTKKDEKNGSVKPNGFGWVSADGESNINLTGMVHFDTRNISNGLSDSQDKDSASGADNFEVRRARIGINGTFWKNVDFEVLTNLVGSSSNLVHRAYVNYNFNPQAQVRIGRFKQPFSLEELTSANAIDFMERSYGNQMVASHRNGAMVFGAPTIGLTYAFSVYQDGFNELSNTNQVGTLGIGRVTANLAELQGGSSDTVIHLGAALDKGKYEVTPTTSTDTGSVTDSTRKYTRATVLSFRTENRGLANAYRAQVAGDVLNTNPGYGLAANNNTDISKNLVGVELALATGAFKFQSEYFDNTYSVKSVSCVDGASSCTYPQFDLKASAAYYEVIYNLTGESWANSYKSGAFTTIKPKANFSLGSNGGWGAWQLGLRYSSYEVSEPSYFAYSSTSSGVSTRKNISGSTDTNGFSRGENSTKASTWTLGVNWILNPNSRWIFNYADTKFGTAVTYLSTSSPTSLGTTSREQVMSVRTQLNF